MTVSEAKAAFFDECPVVLDALDAQKTQLHYAKISALIYRKDSGGVTIMLELLDHCGHSVTIAAAERVTRAAPAPAPAPAQTTLFMPQRG